MFAANKSTGKMSENSSVLQRLLAERRSSPSSKDEKNNPTETDNKNDHQQKSKTKRLMKSRSEEIQFTPPSNENQDAIKSNEKWQQKPLTLIPRLRQEFFNQQQTVLHQENMAPDEIEGQTFQDRQSQEDKFAHLNKTYGIALNRISSFSDPKHMFSGHPKSNSSGDEFLYTDRQSKVTRSAVARRRNNSRGKGAAVVRSRSMHAATTVSRPERYQQNKANIDLASRLRPSSAASVEISLQRNTSDCSSVSSGSLRLDKHSSLSRSASSGTEEMYYPIAAVGNKQINLQQTSLADVSSNKRINNNIFTTDKKNTHQQLRQTDIPTPGMEMPAVTQHSVMVPAPRHGPYYAQIPSQPLNQITTHQSTPSSPPRGPPPPYPTGSNISKQSEIMDAPQRPNSLALDGQTSRRKNTSGPSAPALTSPIRNTNYVNPFSMTEGTPVRGTPFYSFPQDKPNVQNNFHNHQQQFQHHITQQEHYNRTSAPAYTNSSTQQNNTGLSSQSSSSSSTAVGTPVSFTPHTPIGYTNERETISYSNQQPASGISPAYTHNYGVVNGVKMIQDYAQVPGYSTNATTGGYNLGKSDSIASSTSNSSSGSRIARRTKRNSKNFSSSNTSGSSSGTGGSRPNSSADLMDILMAENESLRSQVSTFEKKLTTVTEGFSSLNESAMKREQLDKELRINLESKNRNLECQNESLEERVKTLNEMIAMLQSSNQGQGSHSNQSASELMMLKENNQRISLRCKDLENEVAEKKDEMSELRADYDLLLQSLKKKQEAITQLKKSNAKKESNEISQLMPILQMLRKTICDRQKVEQDLTETLRLSIQQNRSSLSSNDEGVAQISPQQQVQKNEKLLRTKAGMLKLQQMYLSKHISDSSEEYRVTVGQEVERLENVDSGYNAIGAMLHRHTISDPSFNKIPASNVNSSLRRLNEADVEPINKYDVTNRPSPRRRRKHENKNPDVRHAESKIKQSLIAKNIPTNDNKILANDEYNFGNPSCTCSENVTNEFDSPSEGYHSQQSSGSPTPSSERSSMHFAENDPRVANFVDGSRINAGKSLQPKTVIVRRKSSEILTKLADV